MITIDDLCLGMILEPRDPMAYVHIVVLELNKAQKSIRTKRLDGQYSYIDKTIEEVDENWLIPINVKIEL